MKDSLDPQDWWEAAMRDRRVARIVYQEDPDDLASNVCTNCQQACEKMLKAYLLTRGWPLERTHDLRALVEEGRKSLPELDQVAPRLTELSADFLPSRYPTESEWGFAATDAAEAVELMDSLTNLLRPHIAKQ